MKSLAMMGALLALLMLGGAAWLGVFKTIEVKEGSRGPWRIAFQEGRGPYKGAGKAMEEVRAEVERSGAKAIKGYGLYFDDPKQVPQDKLRWEAGVLVDEVASKILARAKGRYTLKDMVQSEAIHASFPFKSMLSIFVGISKVYPALDKKRQQLGWGGGPIMELYGDEEIEYLLLKVKKS